MDFAGVIETALLSLLPAILVPALSPFAHEFYSWGQALQFGVLWAMGGVLIFTMGFLASVLFSGEYSVAVAAMILLFAYSITTDLPGVERYIVDIHDTMNGSGTPEFKTLAMISLTATAIVGLAALITIKNDY